MTLPSRIACVPVLLLVSACASVGPDYRAPPATATGAVYKEQGPWAPGQPLDERSRGPWWTLFHDPVLDALERQVTVSNQNLAAAEAAYRVAAAAVSLAQAGEVPTLGASAGTTRQGGHGAQPFGGGDAGPGVNTVNQLGINGSWTIDLWGRIRRQVESATASAQASAGDLANARLSAQATLASDYFQLRSSDALERLLLRTLAAYEQALDITKNQLAGGIVTRADVAQAETQVATIRAQAVAQGAQRATLEHAIAVLTGTLPSQLAIAPTTDPLPVVTPPLVLPSQLLQRRPDIAAAERRVAAANAQIGVAVAAYYPNLDLAGSFLYQGPGIGTLIRAANAVWSVGPSLAETIYDGGARHAQVVQARASYDETVADYRQTVLTAIQQVEDALSTLRIEHQTVEALTAAVTSAQTAFELVLNQYRAGTVSITSVITAEESLLANQQQLVSAQQTEVLAGLNLIIGLGGGWTAAELPQERTIDDRAHAPAAVGAASAAPAPR